MGAETFLHRAALLHTVRASALKYSQQSGRAVNVYQVMGGYEGRSLERGLPKGSHTLLEQIASVQSQVTQALPLGPEITQHVDVRRVGQFLPPVPAVDLNSRAPMVQAPDTLRSMTMVPIPETTRPRFGGQPVRRTKKESDGA